VGKLEKIYKNIVKIKEKQKIMRYTHYFKDKKNTGATNEKPRVLLLNKTIAVVLFNYLNYNLYLY